MSAPYVYGRAGEVDISRAAMLLSLAFGGPEDGCAEWARTSGLENLRVFRNADGIVDGTVLRIEMGQFFSGRSIPMLGVAGVTAAPEVRGGGVATEMMRACVRELHAEQWPISTLYPSTQTLYRKVGYEQVSHRFVFTVPLGRLATNITRVSGWVVKPLDERDIPRVEQMYRTFASSWPGMLDRGQYIWKRLRSWRGIEYRGFGAYGPDGDLAGYLYMAQTRKPDSGRFDLSLSDIAWVSPDAARRMLMFLSDFTTMGDDVVFQGGASHPLLSYIHHNVYKMHLRDPWMLRVTHLEKAVASLAYPESVDVWGNITVSDDTVAQHCGNWQISIKAGVGTCAPARNASPSARMDICTFAQIWSGYISARQAVAMGKVEGDVAEILRLSPAFNAPAPWMTDFF